MLIYSRSLALAYKGLSFKTEWVDWPDIENVCKAIGAEPTGIKAAGGPFYTLPVIRDPETGAVISDSLKIALYLDKTYPNTPPLFPHNTQTFQSAFGHAAYMAIIGAMFHTVALPTANSFSPAGSEYFRATRTSNFGEAFKIPESRPADEVAQFWKALEGGFDLVSTWWDTGNSNGPFIMGDSLTYGDTVIAGLLYWAKVVLGEDSEGWKKFTVWNGGRWARLLKAFEQYENMN